MFCSKCGNQLSDGAKFCTACGKSIGEQKEAVQTTVLTKPALQQEKPHLYYIIAAFVCVAGTVVIDSISGYFFSSNTFLLDALILPLLLISAKKTHYKRLGIASFILVGVQLLLAIIFLYYAVSFKDIPNILDELQLNGRLVFYQLKFFSYIPEYQFLLESIRDFLYILANAICGIAFLKLSRFPDEE